MHQGERPGRPAPPPRPAAAPRRCATSPASGAGRGGRGARRTSAGHRSSPPAAARTRLGRSSASRRPVAARPRSRPGGGRARRRRPRPRPRRRRGPGRPRGPPPRSSSSSAQRSAAGSAPLYQQPGTTAPQRGASSAKKRDSRCQTFEHPAHRPPARVGGGQLGDQRARARLGPPCGADPVVDVVVDVVEAQAGQVAEEAGVLADPLPARRRAPSRAGRAGRPRPARPDPVDGQLVQAGGDGQAHGLPVPVPVPVLGAAEPSGASPASRAGIQLLRRCRSSSAASARRWLAPGRITSSPPQIICTIWLA